VSRVSLLCQVGNDTEDNDWSEVITREIFLPHLYPTLKCLMLHDERSSYTTYS